MLHKNSGWLAFGTKIIVQMKRLPHGFQGIRKHGLKIIGNKATKG